MLTLFDKKLTKSSVRLKRPCYCMAILNLSACSDTCELSMLILLHYITDSPVIVNGLLVIIYLPRQKLHFCTFCTCESAT